MDEGRLTFKEGQQLGKVTYHDSCHLKRTLNVIAAAARTAAARPATSSRRCTKPTCAAAWAASYSLKLPEISAPILERKLDNIKKTGAPLVVMDCPGCVMQIRGGLDKDGAAIKVEHTVQRLAEELE